ncbi:oxidoreductase [Prochlorococcus sp. MIT 1011]|uniref:oxidoreductase n=1 Tax=Prochlorococcus sp. MIT 1011 TaxID=3082520 RepID=UPI0039B37660
MDLLSQKVLITGAAGRIGSAIAEAILKNSGNVILSDINKAKLIYLKENLTNLYSNEIILIEQDISTSQGIDTLFEKALNISGRIDSVVHSAYPRSKGWGTKLEDLKDQYLFEDLNNQLGGAILLSKKVLEIFNHQGSGQLINISSIQGIQAPKFDHYEGTEMNSPIEYSAIKAGIIAITKWLAKYYSNKNIRVNCVSPGGILDNQNESFLKKYRKSCTNIGMLSSAHVADAVVFLLSSSSIAINGQNLIVDDGWSL